MAHMLMKVEKICVLQFISFRLYDWYVLVWTPSGSCPILFDASLLSTSKPPETAALFLRVVAASRMSRK